MNTLTVNNSVTGPYQVIQDGIRFYNGEVIKQRIRKMLLTLCNYRERCYREVAAKNINIFNHTGKLTAITTIRNTVEYFTTASPQAHINLVPILRADILLILPDADNERLKRYREKILNMLTWCESYTAQKQPATTSSEMP
jgi:hypothetical protein